MKFKFYILLLIFISINLQSLQKTKLLLGVSKATVGAVVLKSIWNFFHMRYESRSVIYILKNDDLCAPAAGSIAASICLFHGGKEILQACRNDEQKFKTNTNKNS